MERGARTWKRKYEKHEMAGIMRDYDIITHMQDGAATKVYARHKSTEQLIVWSEPGLRKKITDHFMKQNTEEALINKIGDWYGTELYNHPNDDMRKAWALACFNEFHRIYKAMFPPRQLSLNEVSTNAKESIDCFADCDA